MRVLDLFSGIGGFSLGLERAGMQTVAFCEIEEFPRAVLRKHWPDVPIFEDVRKLRGEDVGPVDVICGGYPCQPFSTAGKRRGAEDDRHLWPEFNRLVAELRPAWVIGENVAGHISMGLDGVLSDLERQGYACRSFVIPACAVDAPHRRDRIWTVAHTDRERGQALRGKCQNIAREGSQRGVGRDRSVGDAERKVAHGGAGENPGDAAHANQPRPQGHGGLRERAGEWALGAQRRSEPGKWLFEPDVGRVANGVPRRVDRLKALGNAVVPQVAEMIGRAIMEAVE